jgi:hypothetical protein
MQLRKLSRALTLALAIGVAASSGAAAFRPALASAPVHKSYVGCVSNGVFKSENGYVIRIRQRAGSPMDLSQWQNKRLRITGNLLPGDNFYLTATPVVVGACH